MRTDKLQFYRHIFEAAENSARKRQEAKIMPDPPSVTWESGFGFLLCGLILGTLFACAFH